MGCHDGREGFGRTREKREKGKKQWVLTATHLSICPVPAVLLDCGKCTVHANYSEGSLGDKSRKTRKLTGRETNDTKEP